MTIPKEWLKPGAIVPVNNETVQRLVDTLRNVPDWVTSSNFDEYSIHVRFNVSVPFEFKKDDSKLLNELQTSIDTALWSLFNKHKGTYSNPRIDINGWSTSC